MRHIDAQYFDDRAAALAKFCAEHYNIHMSINAKKGICRIICAGEEHPFRFAPAPGDLTIAADGGYDYAVRAGIVPDLFVGDCDSVSARPHSECIVLPRVKDVTDTYAAAEEGLRRGYTCFELHCALGGRLSHALANIAVLRRIRAAGGEGTLFGRGTRVRIVTDRAEISGNVCFSVIPSGSSARADIAGAKYSGSFLFTDSDSLGVSNEPLENKTAAVTVRGGEILLIIEDRH